MNERIKELAMQAGLDAKEIREDNSQTLYAFENFDLERFAELVRQDLYQVIGKSVIEQINSAILHEREACAALCESMGVHPALNVWNGGPDWYKRQKECAAAIRARGEPSPAFKNYLDDKWAGIV
jgi:hypothetical protein